MTKANLLALPLLILKPKDHVDKSGEFRLVKKKVKEPRFQRVKDAIMKILKFLGKRYIWPGLIVGFLWSFSAPFVITIFLPSFQDFPQEVIWILFFPLKASFQLTQWIINLELVDPSFWIMLWLVSILIGTFLGATFTYTIHKFRVWKKGNTK